MNFFLYIFYRLKSFYNYKNSSDNWIHAFILFGALVLIHILTIIGFIESIFQKDFINYLRVDNGIIDRFVLFPLLISPVYIVLFIYYRKNKDEFMITIKNFKNETINERKRNGLSIVLYLTISVLLFFISMISPIFIH